MTGDETGKLFVYDAWNRLVAVKSNGGTVLKSYGYDALNHRVSETVSDTTTDLYDSAGWQVLEERVGGVTRVSNVWSPVYVDAMIAWDRDTDANGTLDERLYVTHDANFNVTGLVNTSGAVVERYVYDTYGAVTVLNASWTVLGGSASAWQYLHQGGRVDAVSGLVHFRNRDYSPTLGRWVTMDPIRLGGGDVDLYRAVGNNLVNHLDFLGLADATWQPLTKEKWEAVIKPCGKNAKADTQFEIYTGKSLAKPLKLDLEQRGGFEFPINSPIYKKELGDNGSDTAKNRKNVVPEFTSDIFDFPFWIDAKLLSDKESISLSTGDYQSLGYIAALGKAPKPKKTNGAILYVTPAPVTLSPPLVEIGAKYGVEVIQAKTSLLIVDITKCGCNKFRVDEFTVTGKVYNGDAIIISEAKK